VAALVLSGCVAALLFAPSLQARTTLVRTTSERFPRTLGAYTLVRTWEETVDTGEVVYQWAEYAPSKGTPVAIGISPALTWHDPIICHAVRGEHPLWQGPLESRSAARPVSFNAGFYSDGVTQELEASTQCSGGVCNEFATPRTHFGFIYTPLDSRTLLRGSAQSLPVLVKAEAPVSGAKTDTVRRELAGSIRDFVAAANLQDLTQP